MARYVTDPTLTEENTMSEETTGDVAENVKGLGSKLAGLFKGEK